MKKIKPLFSLIVILVMLTIINPALPSQSTEQTEDLPQFLEGDEDCFAWKFYLLTAMYDLAEKNAVLESHRMVENYYGAKKRDTYPEVDMQKAFPAEIAKKAVNMIIEKEGGHCSEKVLYKIPRCTFDPNYHKRPWHWRGGGSHAINTIHNVSVWGTMDFDYFSKTMDLPMNKVLVSQYEYLINKHVAESEYEVYHYRHIWMLCGEDCVRNKHFYYEYSNSFGICMIAKHHQNLKENGLFYFKYYLEGVSTNPLATLNVPSLHIFIKESDEVAEKYKKKTKSP